MLTVFRETINYRFVFRFNGYFLSSRSVVCSDTMSLGYFGDFEEGRDGMAPDG